MVARLAGCAWSAIPRRRALGPRGVVACLGPGLGDGKGTVRRCRLAKRNTPEKKMVSRLERLLCPQNLHGNHGHALLCTPEGFSPGDWPFLGLSRAEVGFVGGKEVLCRGPGRFLTAEDY